MNNFKVFSAIVTSLLISASLFTACQKSPELPVEETTAPITTAYNGYSYVNTVFTEEYQTEPVRVVPPVPTKKPNNTTKTTSDAIEAVKAEDNKPQSDTVDEKNNGLNILSKSSPVARGNYASVIIMGTSGAEYSIEFYESATQKASYDGLNTIKADTSGIASWNFAIDNACETGDKKIIIRELNSDKYIQTSITVI